MKQEAAEELKKNLAFMSRFKRVVIFSDVKSQNDSSVQKQNIGFVKNMPKSMKKPEN